MRNILNNISDFFFGTTRRVRNTIFFILGLVVIYKRDEIMAALLDLSYKLLQAVADLLQSALPLIIIILAFMWLYKKITGGGSPPPKKK